VARVETEQVVPHEHLPVAIRSGADADRRDRQRLGDALRDRCGNGFEDERETAGSLELARVGEELLSFLGGAALRLPSGIGSHS
jgi:hypothetical protein